MYKVTHQDKVTEYEAEGIKVISDAILLFGDVECTKVKAIIPAGKWDSLEVRDPEQYLLIQGAQSEATPEATKAEEQSEESLQGEEVVAEAEEVQSGEE